MWPVSWHDAGTGKLDRNCRCPGVRCSKRSETPLFDLEVNYPKAVASNDTEGIEAAINWCLQRMQDGERLTVWTSQRTNLRAGRTLHELVERYSDVDHVTGRGGGFVRGQGPVLMAWADMDDIGQLVQSGGNRITALCVISWSDERLRPWVEQAEPDILGNAALWEVEPTGLDPVVVEALRSFTQTINHNNTISAGFEKDVVVSGLLALRDARIPMDAEAMQAWTLANGWSGKNPQRLATYVVDIQAGKRPRTTWKKSESYVDLLRSRVESSAGKVDNAEATDYN